MTMMKKERSFWPPDKNDPKERRKIEGLPYLAVSAFFDAPVWQHITCFDKCTDEQKSQRITQYLRRANFEFADKKKNHHPLQTLVWSTARSDSWWDLDVLYNLPRTKSPARLEEALRAAFVRPRHSIGLSMKIVGLDKWQLKNLLVSVHFQNVDVANCRLTARPEKRTRYARPFREVDCDLVLNGDEILYRDKKKKP